MKIRRAVLLSILLLAIPALSACDLLGMGNSKEQERDYYEQQIEAYKKIQEASQKQNEEYNQRLQKGLQDYTKAFAEWQYQQQQLQLQQLGISTANQTSASTDNSD